MLFGTGGGGITGYLPSTKGFLKYLIVFAAVLIAFFLPDIL